MDPEYVLDRMDMYEVRAILDRLHLKSKESWEQARLVSYMIAQVNSTKQIDIKDFIKFPWDSEGSQEQEDTREDIQKMMEEMRIYENKLNNR